MIFWSSQNSTGAVCLAALFASLASCCFIPDTDCEQPPMLWAEFKSQLKKNYSNEEDGWRRELFEKEQMRVHQHNSNPFKSHVLGLDFMSDWNDTEFLRTTGPHFTLRSFCDEDEDDEDEDEEDDEDDFEVSHHEGGSGGGQLDPFVADILSGDAELPCSVDWRRVPGRVGQVKFQLGCGACWAFAATGLLEGQQVARNFSNTLVELSEQQLIDCKEGGNGCLGGGFAHEAIKQVAAQGGIMSEKDYPYARNGSLCRFESKKAVMSAKGFVKLPSRDEHILALVVARYGPVAISLDLRPLRGYRSGIITADECQCSEHSNHEALIVGYGSEDELDYWLVKNSWSDDWGDAGYFRIQRGEGLCGIDKDPIIATF